MIQHFHRRNPCLLQDLPYGYGLLTHPPQNYLSQLPDHKFLPLQVDVGRGVVAVDVHQVGDVVAVDHVVGDPPSGRLVAGL